MAARKRLWQPDQARLKIQTTQLIRRLAGHALGQVEMSPTQVRATEVLLRKVLPDLSQVTGTFTHARDPLELSDAELADIAAGNVAAAGRTSDDGEADGSEEPDRLH